VLASRGAVRRARAIRAMSEGTRTVIAMAEQMQLNRDLANHSVLEDPCPRCGSATIRAIVYGPLDFEVEIVDAPEGLGAFDDAPIFDCRDCGFEWGFAVRELLS
jgi:predicted RNA-binding Zn-ribbon protein involved in translation (DUF1610 family)